MLFRSDERAAVGLFGDAAVARSHAEIQVGPAGAVLKTLDVAGRTKVNGSPVVGPRPLRDGDTIELGGTRLVFRNRG